jgi:outer membrane protein OmpA-like peptidoglycan-associated protein
METPGESRIARRRMAAAYGVLLKGGVDPHKIGLQYQPVGDHVADNETPEGRAANRRAEVEVYPVAPERLAVQAGTAAAAVSTL